MGGPTIPQGLVRRVRRRARNRCEYCGYPQVACYVRFECDHVIPRSKGGATTARNLVLSCPTCNGAKHDHVNGYDPPTRQVVPLFNPRTQYWDEHFRWSSDFLKIIGTTPTGRATVRRLRMNQRGVRLIRLRLLAFGQHPVQQTQGGSGL